MRKHPSTTKSAQSPRVDIRPATATKPQMRDFVESSPRRVVESSPRREASTLT